MTLVSALVVAYNPGDELFACIGRLSDIARQMPLEIILVDNASANDVAAQVARRFPQVTLVRSEENLGFGGGNNLAFAHSHGDYICCVNPDLVLEADALPTMLRYLQQHRETGVIGPRTEDGEGGLIYTARAAYTVPRLWAKYWRLDALSPRLVYGRYRRKMQQEHTPFEADWLQGSCLLLPRTVYSALGGFDEGFFLYMEDVDLCARSWEAGWRVVYHPQALAFHKGGATTAKFHVLRVRGYHLSPLHYFRKRGQFAAVYLLRLIFTVELLSKIILRSLAQLVRPASRRAQHRAAEAQVLRELWGPAG